MGSKNGTRRSWNWRRQSIMPLFAFIFMFIFSIVLMIVTIYLEDNIILILLGIYIFLLFLYLAFFTVCIYLRRKNMWIRTFPFGNKTVIDVIETVLTNKKLHYRKLRGNGLIKQFPMKYVEIFEIKGGEIFIKVHKELPTGSIVHMGPINKNNEMILEDLKQNLDNAFRPQVL